MKRSLALLMTFILPITMLAGCNTQAQSSESSSSTGIGAGDSASGDGVLTIYSFTDTFRQAADDYQAASGNQVNYVEIGSADYQTKLNTVLGTNDEPDIACLERSFVGTYIPMDDFIDLQEKWGDQPEMQEYINNTLPATKDPGYYGDVLKAVGWQLPVGAYFYRSDLASQYLGINSVDEMEAAISTTDDFYSLQDKLDATGAGMKLQADLYTLRDAVFNQDQIDPYVVDGTFTITKGFQDDLDTLKSVAERGIYYTYNDEGTVINGAAQNAFLGAIAPSWYIKKTQNFNQSGLWSVAKSPFNYSAGGTFMAVTQNADMDLAWDFLTTTVINPQWLADNIDKQSLMGNTDAINIYQTDNPGGNAYFGGEDVAGKFLDIAQNVNKVQPATNYDQGIVEARNACFEGYVLNGTYSTVDEACKAYAEQVQTMYPDLNVVIE